jgi:hypothetical protein
LPGARTGHRRGRRRVHRGGRRRARRAREARAAGSRNLRRRQGMHARAEVQRRRPRSVGRNDECRLQRAPLVELDRVEIARMNGASGLTVTWKVEPSALQKPVAGSCWRAASVCLPPESKLSVAVQLPELLAAALPTSAPLSYSSTVAPARPWPETVAFVDGVAPLTDEIDGTDGGAKTVTEAELLEPLMNVEPPTGVEVCVAVSECEPATRKRPRMRPPARRAQPFRTSRAQPCHGNAVRKSEPRITRGCAHPSGRRAARDAPRPAPRCRKYRSGDASRDRRRRRERTRRRCSRAPHSRSRRS